MLSLTMIIDGGSYTDTQLGCIFRTVQGSGVQPLTLHLASLSSEGAFYKGFSTKPRVLRVPIQIIPDYSADGFIEEQRTVADIIHLLWNKDITFQVPNAPFEPITIQGRFSGGLEGSTSTETVEQGILSFIAHTPFWRTSDAPYETASGPTTLILENIGDAITYPVFSFINNALPTSGPHTIQITNATTGLSLWVDNITLIMGETLTVDCVTHAITTDARGSLFWKLRDTSNFSSFFLAPGNNSVTLGVDTWIDTTIEWDDLSWVL